MWGTLNSMTFWYKLLDGCTQTKLQPFKYCKSLGSISKHFCTKFQAFRDNVKSGSTCPAFPYMYLNKIHICSPTYRISLVATISCHEARDAEKGKLTSKRSVLYVTWPMRECSWCRGLTRLWSC